MTSEQQKIGQYLGEAYATERALKRVLQEQIAVTPTGQYRQALQTHLHETTDHAERVRARLQDLGVEDNPVATVAVLVQSLVGQAAALVKAPLDLIRGSGGEEKVLKNAKDAAATEALEIATYIAIERLASDIGDDVTGRLAREIREDEERMLDRILTEIPQLTAKVLAADVRGNPSYDVFKTGAGEAVQEAAQTGRDVASAAADEAVSTARTARKVPGVARAEGEVKGAVASAADLPIAGYDDLTAEDIVGRLGGLSQIDLSKVDAYERLHADRSTILDKISSLRGDEPWPGYDELTVQEIRKALSASERDAAREVADYERRHKDRAGVIQATEATVSA